MPDLKWFVYGKQPMFADYFSLGDNTHLAAAFKNWVFLGFQEYINSQECSRQNCSYRFWSKGGSAQTLALGLLQSSADSLGRPYPLLFIGTVLLPHWQKRWPGLVVELDQIWAGLEKIAQNRSSSLQDMAVELKRIEPPAASEHNSRQDNSATTPNAVFAGGCDGGREMTSFTKPLTARDFVMLWTARSSAAP